MFLVIIHVLLPQDRDCAVVDADDGAHPHDGGEVGSAGPLGGINVKQKCFGARS